MDKFKPKKIENYIAAYIREAIPGRLWKTMMPDFFKILDRRPDREYILARARHYNKIDKSFTPGQDFIRLRDLWHVKSSSMYRHDAWRTSRWFDQNMLWRVDFLDVNWICPSPTITKSRPISDDNQNNIILKLDRCRHFNFIHDPYRFKDKADKGIFMADIGDIGKMNRAEFMKMYFGSEICDCGSIRNLEGLPDSWLKPKMKIREMLRYKYILALEGNDVATNLKWAMSSNSIAVMPRPTCETWFLESSLKPDFHYIEIRPDYADLPEKLEYYSSRPEEAEVIIKNAHEYIRQFLDQERENLTEYLTLLKYFQDSGQIPESISFQ